MNNMDVNVKPTAMDLSAKSLVEFAPKLGMLILTLLPVIIPINILFATSVIYKNLKGLVYIFFLFSAFFARLYYYYLFTKQGIQSPGYQCWMSTYVLSFTFAYICGPMLHDLESANSAITSAFVLILAADFYNKASIKCDLNEEAIVNSVCGICLGLAFCYIIFHTGYAFFTETSSREYCSKPSAQKFKCTVYKNGEILTTF
jgi:hypothetical protein